MHNIANIRIFVVQIFTLAQPFLAMSTIKAFIRTSVKKKNGKINVRFRLSDGRNIQLFHKSEIEVDPDAWDSKNECIKSRIVFDQKERDKFNNSIEERKSIIRTIYNETSNKEVLTSEELEALIDRKLHPNNFTDSEPLQQSIFEIFELFISNYRGTERMKQHYRCAKRIIQRYELYNQLTEPTFKFTFNSFDNAILLTQLENFIHEEYIIYEQYPELYKAVPDSRPPKQRGKNRINKILRYLRTVIKWAIEQKLTDINQVPKFNITSDLYGTPYYITIDERNALFDFDLSDTPELAEQRDIFVFQCLIGCRVGDLMRMKKNNVIDNAIEYVPGKTKEIHPVTIRVPLNKISKEIINRYSNIEGNRLLPFINEQDYNYAIKDIFNAAGLNRLVTKLNPTTGLEEKRPLSEIASSHLARRTFIGNLYKKVKDPNLVGSLTGHTEGSKAFARYREIDEEMKQDLVNLLE